MKQVIILIGLKGSGKTYIGSLLQEKLGIYFLRVENLWLSLKSDRLSTEYFVEGFSLVEHEIDRILASTDRVVIESTGTTSYFKPFLERLRNRYVLKLIRIVTSPAICVKRVKARDVSVHIPVSDDLLEQVNREALEVDLDYDAILENEHTTNKEIIDIFKKILQ